MSVVVKWEKGEAGRVINRVRISPTAQRRGGFERKKREEVSVGLDTLPDSFLAASASLLPAVRVELGLQAVQAPVFFDVVVSVAKEMKRRSKKQRGHLKTVLVTPGKRSEAADTAPRLLLKYSSR